MINIPEPKLVDINKITVDGKNPNVMSDKNREALKNAIKKYGFLIPLITNKDYKLADGEHRLNIAKELKFKQVPVIALNVNEVDRRILRQIMNKLKGEHQEDLDTEEFRFLYENDHLKELTKFLPDINLSKTIKKIEKLGLEEDDLDIDKAYQKPKYQINKGENWKLGDHRLMCGDATSKDDVTKLMEGNKTTMVFTDPPFNLKWTGRGQEAKGSFKKKWRVFEFDDVTEKVYLAFLEKTTKIIKTCLETNGSFYICIDWRQYPYLLKILAKHLYVDELIVGDKTFIKLGGKYRNQHELILYGLNETKEGDLNYNESHELISFGAKDKIGKWFGGRCESNVWSIITDASFKYVHPTQKPVELAERAIRNSSDINDSVLDLFGGSGSTLMACEKLGRKCYMMELDPVYCSVIINRWEKYTNKKAKKVV